MTVSALILGGTLAVALLELIVGLARNPRIGLETEWDDPVPERQP